MNSSQPFPQPWPTWRKRLTAGGTILAFAVVWFLPAILTAAIHYQATLFYALLTAHALSLIALARAYRGVEFMYELPSDWTWKSAYLKEQLAHTSFPDYVYYRQSDADHREKQRMTISRNGTVVIHRGFLWDGCTPKFSFFGIAILGTYEGDEVQRTDFPQLAGRKAAYYASLVHDAFYLHLNELSGHGITKTHADHVFFEILSGAEFAHKRLYYRAVDVFGTIRKRIIDLTQSGAGASGSSPMTELPSNAEHNGQP